MTTSTITFDNLKVCVDGLYTTQEKIQYASQRNKMKKQLVAVSTTGVILGAGVLTTYTANQNDAQSQHVTMQAESESLPSLEEADAYLNDRTETTTYYTLKPVTLAADASPSLQAAFAQIPEFIKESNVLKGVVIENEEQLALLQSDEVVYSNDVLPIQVIENGKANVSDAVRSFEPVVREELAKVDRENLTEFMLALLQQESGGLAEVLGSDPFQSSQSKNEEIGSIVDPSESVAQGVAAFTEKLELNNMDDAVAHGDIRTAIQSYNFGGRISRIAEENHYGYSVKFIQDQSVSLAKEYNKAIGTDWRGDYAFGDFTYVSKIFQYFEPQADWETKANEAAAEVLGQSPANEQTVAETEPTPVVESAPEINDLSSEEDLFNYAAYMSKDKIAKIDEIFSGLTVESMKSSNSLKGKVIVIDAGHGGSDPGAVSKDGKVIEADVNLSMAKKLQSELQKHGATVIMTRSTASGFLELTQRGQMAVSNNADIFISVHNNSQAIKSANFASGTETYYSTNNANSAALAQAVHPQIMDAVSVLDDRGVKANKNYAVLKSSGEAASILLEVGFVSSPVDGALLNNPNAQQSTANAVAKGVINYFDSIKTEDEVAAPIEDVAEELKEEKVEESTTPKEEIKEESAEQPTKEEQPKEETTDDEVDSEEQIEESVPEEEITEEVPADEPSEEEIKEEEVKEETEEPTSILGTIRGLFFDAE